MSEEVSKSAVIEMRGVDVATLRDTSLIVLENVNWTVLSGEFWVVAGAPHSGKSDLLLHAAGLMTPVNGAYCLFGSDAREFDEGKIADRRRIGVVFTDGKLFN